MFILKCVSVSLLHHEWEINNCSKLHLVNRTVNNLQQNWTQYYEMCYWLQKMKWKKTSTLCYFNNWHSAIFIWCCLQCHCRFCCLWFRHVMCLPQGTWIVISHTFVQRFCSKINLIPQLLYQNVLPVHFWSWHLGVQMMLSESPVWIVSWLQEMSAAAPRKKLPSQNWKRLLRWLG